MAANKILIVDDDPDVVEAMKLTLEASGYEVFEASNGKEGLEKVKEVNPDLLILDVMMDSDTEGFQVSYKLKTPEPEYAAYAKLPILMVTAIGKMKGMQFSPKKDEGFLPVDDFVEKPIQPRVLLEKVKTLIGN
ncbi:MAG: response regulator [Candidatus Latescibacteria bacterium]|nr:response regulator [Candidatus Latescibacterota bacterium]MCK5380575.1 response regulator [Candidatus Latescibacterota bacterium]MCK5527823.1 response regulator [Candidatus Latescibacterota bacterium]MCK5733252.1 response regulator [Candidatus Latescibacterota bacterium]